MRKLIILHVFQNFLLCKKYIAISINIACNGLDCTSRKYYLVIMHTTHALKQSLELTPFSDPSSLLLQTLHSCLFSFRFLKFSNVLLSLFFILFSKLILKLFFSISFTELGLQDGDKFSACSKEKNQI